MKIYKLAFTVFFVLCLVVSVGAEVTYRSDLVIKDLPGNPVDIKIYDGDIWVLYAQPAIEIYRNGLVQTVIWGPTLAPDSVLSGFFMEKVSSNTIIWLSDTNGNIYRYDSAKKEWNTYISDNAYRLGRIIRIGENICVQARKKSTGKYYLMYVGIRSRILQSGELIFKNWSSAIEFPDGFDFCVNSNKTALYISDKYNHKIKKYNIANKTLEKTWFVSTPSCMGCDSSNNVFVFGGKTVKKYDAAGTFLAEISGDFGESLSIAPHQGKIYVADRIKKMITRFTSAPAPTTTSTINTTTTTQPPNGTSTLSPKLAPSAPLLKR